MANICGIQAGIAFDNCADFISGGLKNRVYVGNSRDLVGTSLTDGYVSALDFAGTAVKGLYEFFAPKQSHSAGVEITRNEGGVPSFLHTVNLRVFTPTPLDIETIEELSKSDVFAIVEISDGRFQLYGVDLGLNLTAGSQNTGGAPDADTRTTLTLTSLEPAMPKWFLATDYATTLALLNSYVV